MSAAPTATAISRYRFVSRIAIGGMAEIYAADAAGALGLTRRVALKRILPQHANDDDFVRMFLNEARLASTLQHPNIVQTFDVLDDRGSHLIVMELLDGLNLLGFRRLLYENNRAFTPAQALYIIDRVLSGLHYAHERSTLDGRALGVVHRDVSPHNIVITVDGGVKLVDFGVAKAAELLGKQGTASGVVKGKVLYMSPEQCQGQELDRRTDIWAAGVLLYVLLTGKAPFKGKNPYDTMRAIIHDYPIAPSNRMPTLTAEVDAIVLSAMAKDPTKRFATARDMQRAVSDAIRRNELYLTDVEFLSFVEECYEDWDRPDPDIDSLPHDVVIAEGGTEQVTRFAAAAGHGGGPIAETEHAVVERAGTLTLLKLRGTLDERFEPDAIRPHLTGIVLVDSEAVNRITSYGIRGLLRLFEPYDERNQLIHMRCSVAFVQQVGMIRGVLGGGKVVSFQLPYIDPVNGNYFVDVLTGREAKEALNRGRAPERLCPGFPSRVAEFDEDAPTYLCFQSDFLTDPPSEVSVVISALELEERQVEMAVTAKGTAIFIRRPIDEDYRWRNVLSGLEGRVHIDMQGTPSWTSGGVDRLLGVLSREADAITGLTLLHMPSPLCGALPRFPRLAARVSEMSTVRVHARCEACRAPRRVATRREQLVHITLGAKLTTECPSCGGPLLANEDLTSIARVVEKDNVPPQPVDRGRAGETGVTQDPQWVVAMLAVTLFGLLALVVLMLWVTMQS